MSLPRPRLLVSVRDADEALDALAGGADWIDLKEPRRGALGAVDAGTARSVVEAVAGRAPISAASGELRDWAGVGAALVDEPLDALLDVVGVSLVKLGSAGFAHGSSWRAAWLHAHSRIAAAGKELAAVVYADSNGARAPQIEEVLDLAEETRSGWALWDTYDKTGGSLACHVSCDELAAQLAAARTRGMRTVVAGQLDLDSIPLLPWELIDMIAVRGAACLRGRDSSVCRNRVAKLRNLLGTGEPMMLQRGCE